MGPNLKYRSTPDVKHLKVAVLSLFTRLAHSKEVHFKIINQLNPKGFTVMSLDLNKICVTFPSSILDMIIVCFICFDNSLFAGLIFGRFTVIFPMSKRFSFPMFG